MKCVKCGKKPVYKSNKYKLCASCVVKKGKEFSAKLNVHSKKSKQVQWLDKYLEGWTEI